MAARKTQPQQDKYDNLLLSIVQSIEEKTDDLTTEVAKQGVNLKLNTSETSKLKDEVRETNGNVKDLQTHAANIKKEVVEIKKVVFPEVVASKDLPNFWKDPIVIKVTAIVVGAIILILLGLKDQIGKLL